MGGRPAGILGRQRPGEEVKTGTDHGVELRRKLTHAMLEVLTSSVEADELGLPVSQGSFGISWAKFLDELGLERRGPPARHPPRGCGGFRGAGWGPGRGPEARKVEDSSGHQPIYERAHDQQASLGAAAEDDDHGPPFRARAREAATADHADVRQEGGHHGEGTDRAPRPRRRRGGGVLRHGGRDL